MGAGWVGAPGAGGRLLAAAEGVMSTLSEFAHALAPKPRRPRTVAVPRFVGLRASEVFLVAARADVRTEFVQLSSDPAPVDGKVVQQDIEPGTMVKRDSLVRLGVTHDRPAADPGPTG